MLSVSRDGKLYRENCQMKKREITDIELKNIISLRQLGSNWTKIEDETKVERRAAKRAYEEWKRDKESREQDAIRFRINAEAWHEHTNDLVSLAAGLVSKLSLSPLLADLEKNSEQFLSVLWKEDLLQRYVSPETGEKIYPGDQATYWREQELLFESLKVHTEGKVKWDALDNWNEAKDKCVDIIPKLRKEISVVVGNSILQQQMVGSIEDAKKLMAEGMDPQKRIEDIILTQLWQRIYLDKLDSKNPRFEVENDKGKILVVSRDMDLRARGVTVFPFFDANNKGLAEKLTQLCNSSFDILIIEDEVLSLYNQITNIRKAYQELGVMLIPVKLKPIIIHSRCELCPV
jgi:hypothetical protein